MRPVDLNNLPPQKTAKQSMLGDFLMDLSALVTNPTDSVFSAQSNSSNSSSSGGSSTDSNSSSGSSSSSSSSSSYYAQTVFAQEIICIAKYWWNWYAKGHINYYNSVNPGNSMTEQQIYSMFRTEYYNNTADNQYDLKAWCEFFMQYLNNETCINFNPPLPSPYPDGTKAGGNQQGGALMTYKWFQQNTNITCDNVPIPGSQFIRWSDAKGTGWHTGLVIRVDFKDPTIIATDADSYRANIDKFYTIEGNIVIDDSADTTDHGIGCWEYLGSDLGEQDDSCLLEKTDSARAGTAKTQNGQNNCVYDAANGYCFRFIHIETQVDDYNKVNAQVKDFVPIIEAPDYVGGDGVTYSCKVVVTQTNIVKGEKKEEVTINQDGSETDTETVYTDQDVQQGNTDYYFEQQPPPVRQSICQDVIFKIPPASAIQHYSVLNDHNVAGDIFNTSNAKKGSALWHPTGIATPKVTGFGMFRDMPGNTYIITDDQQNPSNYITANMCRTSGLAGPNPNIILMNASGSADDKANYLSPASPWVQLRVRNLWDSDSRGGGMYFPEMSTTLAGMGSTEFYDKQTSDGQPWYAPGIGGENANHLFRPRIFMQWIEEQNIKFNNPVVFSFNFQANGTITLGEILTDAIGVLQVVTTVIGFPIPPVFFQAAKNIIIAFQSGSTKDLITACQSLEMALAQAANMIAPEETKALESEFESLYDPIKDGITNSMASLGAYLNTAKNQIMNVTLGYFPTASKGLGLDPNELSKLHGNYQGVSPVYQPFDLTNILSGHSLPAVNKFIQNTKNMLLSNQILNGGVKIYDNIKLFSDPTNYPLVRDLLISGAARTLLPGSPNAPLFAQALLCHPDNPVVSWDATKRTNKDINLHAALLGTAFGYVADSGAFDTVTSQALTNEAAAYYYNPGGPIPYVLPASIPPEKKECYKFEIENSQNLQGTKFKVIDCPDGWTFDKITNTCKNPNISVSVYKYPPCIVVRDGSTWFSADDNHFYPATVTNLGQLAEAWTVLYDGVNYPIKDCTFTIPCQGTPGKIIQCMTTPATGPMPPSLPNVPVGPGNTTVTPVFTPPPPPLINVPLNPNNPGNGQIPVLPPIIKLPPCIKVINGQYFYSEDWTQDPTGSPASVDGLGTAIEQWFVMLGTGAEAVTQILTVDKNGNCILSKNNSPIPPCILAHPPDYLFQWQGNYYTARVEWLGSSKEAWYAEINGTEYLITNCTVNVPGQNTVVVTPPPPPPPPVIKLPPCITVNNDGSFTATINQIDYPASVSGLGTPSETWTTTINGQIVNIVNCSIVIPSTNTNTTTPGNNNNSGGGGSNNNNTTPGGTTPGGNTPGTNTTTPPPVIKLPDCITVDNNGNYIATIQGKAYQATVTDLGLPTEQWYIMLNGQLQEIFGCAIPQTPLTLAYTSTTDTNNSNNTNTGGTTPGTSTSTNTGGTTPGSSTPGNNSNSGGGNNNSSNNNSNNGGTTPGGGNNSTIPTTPVPPPVIKLPPCVSVDNNNQFIATINGISYNATVTNLGLPGEQWFTNISGMEIEIKNCILVVNTPPPQIVPTMPGVPNTPPPSSTVPNIPPFMKGKNPRYDCLDCPKYVERYEKYFYEYPPAGSLAPVEEECDEC